MRLLWTPHSQVPAVPGWCRDRLMHTARCGAAQQGRAGAPRERPSAAARDNPLEVGEAQGAQGVFPVRGGVLALERKPFTTSGGL